MGGIRLANFDGKSLTEKFTRGTKRYGERSIKAIQKTAFRASDEIEKLGRADIARAGDFGSERWQNGLQAKVSYQSRADLTIRLTHSVKYWKVFEYAPTVIRGKPLLWIPLDFAGVPSGLRARDYPEQLFRIDRGNGKAPLLVSDTGPKYFGKEFVTIRTKWHLRSIVRKVARKLKKYYNEEMKKNGR